MQKVSIIDSGLTNLFNVSQAFEYIGASVNIVSSPDEIVSDHLILPGVGSYENGMKEISRLGLIDHIYNHINSNKPFLGICLGMQMMLKKSHEFGIHKGLGVIDGEIIKIPNIDDNNIKHKIPHIGWNDNIVDMKNPLTSNIDSPFSTYFVHSYMASLMNKDNIVATTNYNGIDIVSIINHKSSYGCQFHPEKSGEIGLHILENFLKI